MKYFAMENQQVIEAVTRAVEQHQIFGDLLTTAEKEYLLDHGVVRSVLPGEQLCQQYQRDNRVFILVVGEVEVSRGQDAQKTHIASLKQGEIFGEIAALFGMPRVSDVFVTKPSVILEIHSEVLTTIIDNRAELRDAILQRFRTRVAETAIRSVELFRYIPESSMQKLVENASLIGTPPGSILIEEGETGDAFYVVLYGNMRVSHNVGGRHLNLALLQPGDYFGEWSLLTGAPRAATVSALSQSELVAIERAAFLEVVQTYPEIRDRIDLEAHNRHEQLMASDQIGPEVKAHQTLDRIKEIIHNQNKPLH